MASFEWAMPGDTSPGALLRGLEAFCEQLRSGELEGYVANGSIRAESDTINVTSFRDSVTKFKIASRDFHLTVEYVIWPGPTAIARQRRLERQRDIRARRRKRAAKGLYGKPFRRHLQFRRRQTKWQRWLEAIREVEEYRNR